MIFFRGLRVGKRDEEGDVSRTQYPHLLERQKSTVIS